MPTPEEIVKDLQARFSTIDHIQMAMEYLKQSGFDRGDSMVILQRAYGISHGQAKHLVHHSLAWKADRVAVEKLHDEFERGLDDVKKEAE